MINVVQGHGEQVIENAWPHDGPHTDEQVEQAAAAFAHLAHYLANATQQPRTALPDVGVTNNVICGVADAAGRLGQTLQQLRHHAHDLATDPTLYHGGDVADHDLATVTARQAADHLSDAEQAADVVQDTLMAALRNLASLDHRPNEGT